METRYRLRNDITAVRVEREGELFVVSLNGGESQRVRATQTRPGTIELEYAGRRQRAHVVHDGQKCYVALGSDVYELTREERGVRHAEASAGAGAEGNLEAAMPGQVIAINVRIGEEVKHGQTLVILEAMKMELRVTAPFAGRVERVLVAVGQVVERGQPLAEIVQSV